MRIVLDANVVVAAFAAHGLCEDVFEVCLDTYDLVMSTELIEEIDKNLRKKIKLPGPTVEAIIHLLHENCCFHRPSPIQSDACRDPDDLHILGLAQASQAKCIVTGDKDLLVLRRFGSCSILTPRQFSDMIRDQ